MVEDVLQISLLENGARGLRLGGELDMASAHLLRTVLAEMPGVGQATLDLSELTFMDTSGLHAIIEFARTQNGDGPVVLLGASAIVLRMLELTNMTEHPNLDIRTNGNGR